MSAQATDEVNNAEETKDIKTDVIPKEGATKKQQNLNESTNSGSSTADNSFIDESSVDDNEITTKPNSQTETVAAPEEKKLEDTQKPAVDAPDGQTDPKADAQQEVKPTIPEAPKTEQPQVDDKKPEQKAPEKGFFGKMFDKVKGLFKKKEPEKAPEKEVKKEEQSASQIPDNVKKSTTKERDRTTEKQGPSLVDKVSNAFTSKTKTTEMSNGAIAAVSIALALTGVGLVVVAIATAAMLVIRNKIAKDNKLIEEKNKNKSISGKKHSQTHKMDNTRNVNVTALTQWIKDNDLQQKNAPQTPAQETKTAQEQVKHDIDAKLQVKEANSNITALKNQEISKQITTEQPATTEQQTKTSEAEEKKFQDIIKQSGVMESLKVQNVSDMGQGAQATQNTISTGQKQESKLVAVGN